MLFFLNFFIFLFIAGEFLANFHLPGFHEEPKEDDENIENIASFISEMAKEDVGEKPASQIFFDLCSRPTPPPRIDDGEQLFNLDFQELNYYRKTKKNAIENVNHHDQLLSGIAQLVNIMNDKDIEFIEKDLEDEKTKGFDGPEFIQRLIEKENAAIEMSNISNPSQVNDVENELALFQEFLDDQL